MAHILISLKMTEHLEQRYFIKFRQKLRATQAETIHKIQHPFDDDKMTVIRIKKWFNCCNNGHMSADSDQRSGRPSMN
jgi:hypothetical protein